MFSTQTAPPKISTAADVLKFLRKFNSADFLDPLLTFAERVPAFSGNILELHLNKRENWVDFAPRISRDFDRAMIDQLQTRLPALPEDPALFCSSGTLQNYLKIENVWVEYDAPFTDKPALFFDIDRSEVFNPEYALEKINWLAEYFSLELNGNLRDFFNRVSSLNLSIMYYGFMFSRNSANARLTINGLKAANLVEVLKELGWMGNYRGLEFLRRTFLNTDQRLVIGVDLGEKPEPRIGLEVFDHDPRSFGRRLLEHDLAPASRLDILNDWPGVFDLSPELGNSLSLIHKRQVNKLYARFNHFKFILDNSPEIFTKAYLYYCF